MWKLTLGYGSASMVAHPILPLPATPFPQPRKWMWMSLQKVDLRISIHIFPGNKIK
jgi:hypothetical protein